MVWSWEAYVQLDQVSCMNESKLICKKAKIVLQYPVAIQA